MIRSFDYRRTLGPIEDEVMAALSRVLHSDRLIHGPETEGFEREFAAAVGARHCVAVTSGTAALQVALMALDVGEGDEVITVANTCAPTATAIRLTGARPVFVDVRPDDLQMDVARVGARVSRRCRCILPVHLWGHAVDLAPLLALAERHGVPVVEDCAQAQGTLYRGKQVGTFGRLGCFSFYPTKNLGAYGDAGAVVTDDGELAARLRRLRMYGYDAQGVAVDAGGNFRIAEFQAAVLRVKLRHLDAWLERRRRNAATYGDELRHPEVELPPVPDGTLPSYHQYVVRCRDREAVTRGLDVAEIQYGVHYPTPLHRMPAFAGGAPADGLAVTDAASRRILSLPVHEALTDDEVRRVCEVLGGVPRAAARSGRRAVAGR
jgi:dTDP-3-amino-2,3,6-trideoxy-4-keto-D-glucose/dTDP-3-amino-3,4,6-trideoxy-alpha-D-glucose/dTDP-2,6-dideoxy-D-kanosamine transaminase